MAARLVPVLSCRDVQLAQLAQGRLRAEGIPAFLENEYTVGLLWTYSNALGGVRVVVPEQRLDEARCLLSADASGEIDEIFPAAPDACPACGSFALTRRHRARVAGALSLLFSLPLLSWGVRMRCDACGSVCRPMRTSFPDVPAAPERLILRGRLFERWFRQWAPIVMFALLSLVVLGMVYEYSCGR